MTSKSLESAVAYINGWLAYNFAKQDNPGMAVAISLSNDVLYNQAFGMADVGRAIELTTDHLFRIASHSKTFTATAVMQLQEQGKLKLDDTALTYVPWLAEHSDARFKNITIRQLLSHSAGVIRDGVDSNYWAVEKPFPDATSFKTEMLRSGLIVNANTKLKYSNYGFTLLGQVIESASGQSYHEYVRHNIIEALGLTHTGPEYDATKADQFVTGHTRKLIGRRRLPVEAIDTHAMAPATGFYANAADLCLYMSAHAIGSGKLLSDESKREMQRIQWSSNFGGEREAYGLGMEIEQLDGSDLIGHGGGFPGQITGTLFNPSNKVVVSVLTNYGGGMALTYAKSIHRIINWFEKHSSNKADHDLQRFNGRFLSLWNTEDIVSAGNTIVSTDPDSMSPLEHPEELEYVDDNTLKIGKASAYSSEGELIHFTFQDGKAVEMISAGTTMPEESAYARKLEGKQSISLPKS